MSRNDYLSENEVAEILRLKVSTLKKNRSLGVDHPPFLRIGKRVYYPLKEFKEWMEGHILHRERTA
jgi:predicted DNA-binding transcriptional regulator AlpA